MLHPVLVHPIPERALVDTDLPSHLGDRTRRLDHHLHSLGLELRRELPTAFRHSPSSILERTLLGPLSGNWEARPYRLERPASFADRLVSGALRWPKKVLKPLHRLPPTPVRPTNRSTASRQVAGESGPVLRPRPAAGNPPRSGSGRTASSPLPTRQLAGPN